VQAIDVATQRERWRLAIEGPAVAAPLVAEGAAYVGTNAGILYAVDAATGEERWRFTAAENSLHASPAYANGIVYVGSWDGRLYAVDAATGAERWRVEALGPIWAAPVVVDDLVLVASQGDVSRDLAARVMAVDASTGAKRWDRAIEMMDFSDNDSTMAVVGGVAYLKKGGRLYAIDAATGDERWTAEATGLSGKVAVGGRLICVPGDRFGTIVLLAFDAGTGEQRWQVTVGNAPLSWPVITGGLVLIGDSRGVLYALGDASSPPPSARGSPTVLPTP
jgi:outer membrane protein assembly factor BamB